MRPPSSPAAVGLDLGTTRIKAGLLDERGRLQQVRSVPSPELVGEDGIREADPRAYARAARELVESTDVPSGTPLGIASQRSTFTIWEREGERLRLPLISWQDRRAAGWCDRHRSIEPEVVRRTGLPLSGHYAGPKLAALQQAQPGLREELRSGEWVFGTLETYLIQQWTAGRIRETDLTMAARTLMLDLERADWSPELLAHYDVPATILPRLVSSTGAGHDLAFGLRLEAMLSDQAAGLVAALDGSRRSALVNLGTGAFVLRPTAGPQPRRLGYLTAPILGTAGAEPRYCLEGTINGAGPALDRFGPGPVELPEKDPCRDGFALPDLAGLGSPHWRPQLGLTLSPAARELPRPEQRRVVLEGLLFRIRELLEDLFDGRRPERIVLAGGLTREPAVGEGLAAALGRPVELQLERESGILGAARLAAGLDPFASSPTSPVEPGERGAYLREKFDRWTGWFGRLLSPRREDR